MKRQIIRVEPLASLLEKYKAPTSTVVRRGDTLYVTGAPFEPDTGEICKGPGTIQRQTELVLEQMKLDMRTSLLVAISVVFAALFGQAPEFAQQYAQRLGGAIDELDRIVRHFDED